MAQRILVPTDCSPTSIAALEHAAELARGTGSRILLLHVVERPRNTKAAGAAELATAQKEIEKIAAPLRSEGIEVDASVLAGAPGEEILRAIDREKADLVVMGTHGRRGLRQVLMGSVAEKVAREAPCSVAVVRAKPARAKPASA